MSQDTVPRSDWATFKAVLGPGRTLGILYELHRWLGYPFFVAAIKLGIRANYLTVFSLLLGLAGAALFLQQGYPWTLGGVALVNLGLAVDTIDGPVARYRNEGSEFGAWLGALGVALKSIVIWSCVAIGVYWQRDEPVALILGIVVVGHMFMSYHTLSINKAASFYMYKAGSVTFGSGRQVGLEIVWVVLLSGFALFDQLYLLLRVFAIAGAVPWIILIVRAIQSNQTKGSESSG